MLRNDQNATGQDSPVDPPAATTSLSVDVASPRRPVYVPRGLALGILTAIGGFIDIGDLVTKAVVGSRFGLSLAWAICVFALMSGRVAAVSGRSTFEHGLVTRPAGAAGPAWEAERPAPGRWPGPGTWDYQVIIAGAVAS